MNKESIIKERLLFSFGIAIVFAIAFGLGRESTRNKVVNARYDGFMDGFTEGLKSAGDFYSEGKAINVKEVRFKAVKYAKGK